GRSGPPGQAPGRGTRRTRHPRQRRQPRRRRTRLRHLRRRLGRPTRRDLRHRREPTRRVLCPAHHPQARSPARTRRGRRLRPHRRRPHPHHRPAHPRRRRRRSSLPAVIPMTRSFAAVDLGATSGRVVVGRVGPGELDLTEVHRFPNTPVQLADGLHWDILALYQNVLDGLREARRGFEISSIGIDSWAVDYGLLDTDGALLANPYRYRDPRTSPDVIASVHAQISATDL